MISIMRRLALPVAALAVLLSAIPLTEAFFDELDELKSELVAWQTTHAADFSDLVNTLDDLAGVQFRDVTDGDWFGPYVSSVTSWGIVSGYKDSLGQPTGEFGPGNSVTVAEMLKISLKAAKIDEAQCALIPPLHVQAIGHWAAAFVSCAEGKGMRIVNDPAVDINRSATRAEVVAMIDDAFGDSVPPLFSNFKDTIGHPLEADIAFAYTRGIITGDKDALGIETGAFRPDESINRAEVAKIVYERLRADITTTVVTQ